MDTLFFWISKLVWPLISPGNLLVLLMLACWVLSLGRWHHATRRLLTLLAPPVLALACLPIGDWLLYPLEQRFSGLPPSNQDPDGVVVLGGSIALQLSEDRQQPHLTGSGERLLAFLELADRYPAARLVFTGGSGSPLFQEAREADVARDQFARLGLDTAGVVFERASRNTHENALYTRRLISPQPGDTWLLVTSAYHLPRAMGTFCRQGWKLQPYPVDYQTTARRQLRLELDFTGNLANLELAMREWVGLLAYRLTGRTNRLFPAPADDCPLPGDVD